MSSKDSNKNYAIALFEATRDVKGADLTAVIKNFFQLLVRKQKLHAAKAILSDFEKYAKKQQGIVSLSVTSARTLDASTLQHIKKIFGTMVETVETIDPTILGGVIVKTENTIFDASLKTQLKKLRASLV